MRLPILLSYGSMRLRGVGSRERVIKGCEDTQKYTVAGYRRYSVSGTAEFPKPLFLALGSKTNITEHEIWI